MSATSTAAPSKGSGKVVYAFQRVLDEHEAAVRRHEQAGRAADAEAYRRTQLRPAFVAAIAGDPGAGARGKVVKSLWEGHMYKPLASIRRAVQAVSARPGADGAARGRGH
jgi:hypothetical protein